MVLYCRVRAACPFAISDLARSRGDADGQGELWSSSQGHFVVRAYTAQLLGMKASWTPAITNPSPRSAGSRPRSANARNRGGGALTVLRAMGICPQARRR